MKWKVVAFLALYVIIMLGVVLFFQKGADTTYIDSPGTYGPESGHQEVSGNLTINSPEVTLQDSLIDGNLYLSKDIRGGLISLKDVEITGSLVVMGSPDTLEIEDSLIKSLFVSGGTGKLTVRVMGSTSIGDTLLEAGAVLEESFLSGGANGFASLVLATPAEVSLSGNFASVFINHNNSQLRIMRGRVDTLEVKEQGAGSHVNLAPQVLVNRLIMNSAAVVGGEGHIRLAVINTDGAVLHQAPEELRLAPGVTVEIAGEEFTGEDREDDEEEGETGEDDDPEEARERPQTPLNFQASYSPAANRVNLSWQPGDDDLTDRYLLTRRVGQGNSSTLASVRSLTYSDSNVNPGNTYTYYLVAVCDEGYFSHQVSARVSIPEDEPKMFTLTVTVQGEGGTVALTPQDGEYPARAEVTLEAQPEEGWNFSRWEGEPVDGVTESEITITMNGDYTIKAIFTQANDDNDNDNGNDDDDEEEEDDGDEGENN